MPILQEIKAGQKNKVSLTTLLTGLVCLSVLITLTILLVGSYQSKKQSLVDTTLSLNYSTAAKMSKTIDSLFISMQGSLRYAAKHFSENPMMNAGESNQYLELLHQSNNYFNSIVVVNETGLVDNVVPASVGTTGMYITAVEAKEALAAKKSYLSKPHMTVTTKRLIVFMSEPIFDVSGRYRGYIGGTLYLQENNILTMIFGSNDRDAGGSYFYVVGSDGHLLFHPDVERIGEDVSGNPVVHELMTGMGGKRQVVNSRGVELLAGYTGVPTNGWGVAVVTPSEVVKEQLKRHIRSMLLYTLPPFFLLLLIAVWLAHRLAKPFVSLAKMVSTIGHDKTQLPLKNNHWNREADLLTKTILIALSDIEKRTEQLTQAATVDPLTGLANRRTLETIMNQWTAEQLEYSMIIMDIDRFKSINDTYGHQAGDEVLKHLARIVSQSVRPGDVCCRYGGEEFVVLLANISAQAAFLVAERIRQTFETSESPIGKTVTVSLGIAHYPSQCSTTEAMFYLADQALYKAKGAGKNRTVLAETETTS